MTTAVYFDLDGTLLTYDVPFDEQFRETVGPFGEGEKRRLGGDERVAAYEAYTDRLFAALEACESEPYRRAFESVAETFDFDAPPKTLARRCRETELAATIVSEATKRVVERVAAKHPTGVLTNGDARQQRAKLEAHGLDEQVDEVIVSGAVGVRKPDPEIFELARERLPADTHVYVGDTYEEDVVGARESGFRTIYVVGDRIEANAVDDPLETEAADAVVSSVDELADADSLPPSVRSPFRLPGG